MKYLLEAGYTRCRQMLIDGTLSLEVGSIVDGLKHNRTTFRSVTFAETVRNDGIYKGTQYSDPYVTWDVVVQAIAHVSLKTSYVLVQINAGKIILKSGITCVLNEGFCLDLGRWDLLASSGNQCLRVPATSNSMMSYMKDQRQKSRMISRTLPYQQSTVSLRKTSRSP